MRPSISTLGHFTARALELHAAALELSERLNLRKARTNTLTALGTLYARKGELGRAIGYLEESIIVARQIDNPDALGTACYMLAGILIESGAETAHALLLYEECLTLARTHQRPMIESMTLASLGITYAFTGDLPRAAELLPQALQMQQAMNATMALGWTHQYLGILALLQGDDSRAAHEFWASLEAAPQGGAQYIVPLSLEGIAGVLGLRQQAEGGAVLLGAADAIREAIEYLRPPIEVAFHTKILTRIRAQLPEEIFDSAWQQGHRLTGAQAIAEARTFIRRNGCAV